MLKYLLIGLLIWLVLVPGLKRVLTQRDAAPPPGPRPTPEREPQARTEQIVRCAHCGLHLPEGEAHHDLGGHPYCSAEHARLGRHHG